MRTFPVFFMKSILVIDDDKKLRELISEYLTKNSFKCSTVSSAEEGFAKLKHNHFDLIILDIMMPVMDGFEACRQLRKTTDIPVIMLTARGETTDKIVGLELGADDYLAKPFEPRELLARINAVLRRNELKAKLEDEIVLRHIYINPNKRIALANGKDLELTSTEFELLILFIKNNGKVLSRDEMMLNTRGISWMSFDRSVDVMVSRLRNKFKQYLGAKNQLIKTVHSIGYMFYDESADSK